MYRESSHIDDDPPVPITDIDPVIDFENDQVDIRNDVEDDQPDEDPIADEPKRWIENAELDNVLDTPVDVVDGRDLDGLSEADRFDPFGYITLEISDSSEALKRRVDYDEELPDHEDVVLETPDRSGLPEWEDWSQLDED